MGSEVHGPWCATISNGGVGDGGDGGGSGGDGGDGDGRGGGAPHTDVIQVLFRTTDPLVLNGGLLRPG